MSEHEHDDGERPNEECGPEDCDAARDDVEISRKRLDEMNDEHLESTFRDEVAEAFPIEPIRMGIDEEDGLPRPLDDTGSLALAIPFRRETQVCVEDDTVYVELFEHELVARGWTWRRPWCFARKRLFPPGCESFGNRRVGVRCAFDRDGWSVERLRAAKIGGVLLMWGQPFIQVHQGKLPPPFPVGTLVPARPIRERCVHYRRQCWLNEEEPDPKEFGHKILQRNCMMRRTIGGALLSLSNEGAYACDYREPPDTTSSEQYLDGPDRRRLDGAPPEMVPLFKRPPKRESEKSGDDVGGIFSSKR